MSKLGVGAKIDLELDIHEQIILIKGDGESVCFDLHNIINNDDGWIDGFELDWKQIYFYCKEGLERDERRERSKEMEKR